MTKTEQIGEMLADGKTPAEISEKVGCSLGFVYKVKKKLVEHLDKDEEAEPVDEQEWDDFIKKIKFVPDKKELTDQEDEEDDVEEYQCSECGHVWKAAKDQYQDECPECSVEF